MSAKKLLILVSGCRKCVKLAENVETAVKELGLDCDIEKVTDIERISGFRVMMTPALVVDGEVKIVGKAPSVRNLKTLLTS